MRSSKGMRGVALGLALTSVFAEFFLLARPWYRSWGATPAELSSVFPGDEKFVAMEQETRAVTIDAPVEQVWPWLAQLGQDRGGFYSYDLLENLVGCSMPTTDVLRPEKQVWRPGDRLWMFPPERRIDFAGAPLQTYIPSRALGFATTMNTFGDSSWNFILRPLGPDSTRLIVRGRSPHAAKWYLALFGRLALEPAHFVMEKRTMLGIKALAEGKSRGRVWNHLNVGLWGITFGLWIAFGVMVLRGNSWKRPLAGFVAASLVFQVLTLVQPAFWIGLILTTFVASILPNRLWPSEPRLRWGVHAFRPGGTH